MILSFLLFVAKTENLLHKATKKKP